ncbi:hypothetical protein M409DRAFT_68872 [Zasmidium cellare ATCC 36951]|uniref:Cytochrome P450 n=1 Tax=Zasmidium cellare ATCC 36951 TaxID=1080233 RepID=A0A6A6C6V7_ZASCE|nr:uncharacterized protein M409DRAFT_68872 [Zasmidium cellare ATCC 36951]KAF2162917.1 hypothetical protein M409DRAFT_68872 [Zasmidium cellare ATCC 36951]
MILAAIPFFLLSCILFLIAQKLTTDRLKRFPGPRLAAWTDLWRVLDTYFGSHKPPSSIILHRKYGDIVRVGPNALTFSNPQAIKDIYGTDNRYPKSEMYHVFAPSAGGHVTPSLFSSLDITWHDNLRRAVNPAFNLSALVQYEPFVDNTTREFLSQLSHRYADKPGTEGVVRLHEWMHWYAFDVIGEITYGSPFGALKNASDIDGILAKTHRFLAYGMWAGYMPLIDKLTFKNPVLLWLHRRGYVTSAPNPVVTWALKYQQASRPNNNNNQEDKPQPLLEKFLGAKETHPSIITDKEVLSMGLSAILAGSESTGVTLTAIFYYILKNPSVLATLQAELDTAFPTAASTTPIEFKHAFALPYLDACLEETFRLHPAARFTAERLLPPQGAHISSQKIPGGTLVGINAWALHHRADVFGSDVDSYIPERWLPRPTEPYEQERARIDAMSRTLFHFGAGRFGCISKNVSLLEMYKVVPAVLRAFEMSLEDPGREWRFEDGSFVNVSGVDVRLRRRRTTDGS